MLDGRIKLRHLQCFLAVAEQRSIQRAAERLAVTQPAVSKTLRELEEMLGVQLFRRGRRGALPTADAEAFQRYASASLSALLSRKHHAVLHLRERLRSIYDDFKDLRGE